MPADAPLPHAGVHVPPPLIYAGAIAIGYGLERWHSLPIAGSPMNVAFLAQVGLAAGILWVLVAAAAFVQFRRHRTTFIPNRPARALITSGIYRYSRNPLYLSLVLLYVCVTLLLNSWWPAVLLPVVVLVIDRYVIGHEERYLASAFPDEYAAYAARVRRWI